MINTGTKDCVTELNVLCI